MAANWCLNDGDGAGASVTLVFHRGDVSDQIRFRVVA